MKKLILLFTYGTMAFALRAQKCLDINITSLMGNPDVPGAAVASYKKCTTSKNDHNQITVVDYGTDMVQLDTLINKTTRNFNSAYMAGVTGANMQMPSQDAAAAKDLAEQLKSMTPEQQKEWAAQMAQQKMKNPGAGTMQDDAGTAKLVYQTQDIAVNQMRALNDEFSSKLVNIDDAATKEIQAISRGDKSKCPQGITGLPACDCSNEIEGKYWKQIIVIKDNYNNQKTALLQNYLPKIKALASSVDNTVAKLKNGDAIKSSDLKRMLFSSQSSAFANAFLVTTRCMEDIRKDGATAYANKMNCDNKVYDLSCSSK